MNWLLIYRLSDYLIEHSSLYVFSIESSKYFIIQVPVFQWFFRPLLTTSCFSRDFSVWQLTDQSGRVIRLDVNFPWSLLNWGIVVNLSLICSIWFTWIDTVRFDHFIQFLFSCFLYLCFSTNERANFGPKRGRRLAIFAKICWISNSQVLTYYTVGH